MAAKKDIQSAHELGSRCLYSRMVRWMDQRKVVLKENQKAVQWAEQLVPKKALMMGEK